jgi:hypothetical protein
MTREGAVMFGIVEVPQSSCPHRETRFCPLYVASHIPGAGGCDDGRLDERNCAVDRGMNYAAERRRLEVEQFEMSRA